ncbi:ABC transporter transmembrane domain-containing protein [Caulobacter sp. 17J80-11]|uniref:ABC transporter transmembrane domain-containing protein n=1 Tax=Caulobacter sp. 17J80-11 TaxID=2763502 RepID=UPI0016534A1F|nr:ABC transporter transmembrane domain-containing protein [Caulobacter sp. 17J80-11]MBC6980268.1 ATP-binding cassette domain-containing protein [Caulobacter sp. 17J80-11]
MSSTEAASEARGRPNPGAMVVGQIADEARRREKKRDVRPLGRLLPFMLRHKTDTGLALLFLFCSSAATLGLTGASRLLVDHGFATGGGGIDRWFLLLGAVAIALALATALRYFYVTKSGERTVADLRKAVYAHVMTLDPAFFLKMRTGEVLSRMTTDIQIVETLLSTSISVALRNMVMLLGAVAVLFWVSPRLTALVLLLGPVVLAPMFLVGRQVKKLTVQSQDRFAHAVGYAGESLDALETVQAFGREKSATAQFGSAVEGAFSASLKRIRARASMTALVITLMFCGIAVILWLGARAVISGDMSAGALAQFVFLSFLAAGSVGSLGEAWGDVQKAAGAMERIDELMRERPSIAAPAQPVALPVKPRGEAAFENVTFAYPGRPDLPALNGFTLDVRPGETVALVGPSGAGKSTVFRLLLRFYDPQSGRIRMDGVDLRDADPRAVRERIALVAQEAPLFSGSALDNIRFGREAASRDEAVAAAAEAQALAFLEALPEGLETPLGERARSLSGGQRQRLAIARALVRDAPVLLLDEATSALDAENERLVQQALDEAMKGRTTLVIAHRLATVLRADRIVVMDQGRVVEEGTHADLVARGGLYARLAELQFQGA